MSIKSFLISFLIRIKQNKRSFLFMGIVWIIGVIYYYLHDATTNWWDIAAISFGIREPTETTYFSNLYQLIWPIIFEVIIFGFLLAVLLEKFNPIATSRIIAHHQKNHTIILGYDHIGMRIVEYLDEKKRPYVLIDYDEEKITDLANEEKPVMAANFLEESTLEEAGIKSCKEVFFLMNDFRKAIICAEKIRSMNTSCSLYMRIFEKEFQRYLKEDPWNAIPFSSSNWTMQSIIRWTQHNSGSAIVLGNNHIAKLIATHLAIIQRREVFLIDPDLDLEYYHEMQGDLTLIKQRITRLNKLDDICDIKKIDQVFICWKTEKNFQASLSLTIDLDHNYPQINTYVRIFDEEVMPVFKKYNAKTFSTSLNAFKKLQYEVNHKSNIYPHD